MTTFVPITNEADHVIRELEVAAAQSVSVRVPFEQGLLLGEDILIETSPDVEPAKAYRSLVSILTQSSEGA